MVMHDVFSPESRSRVLKKDFAIAPVNDRIVAGILDVLFHVPFFTLLVSCLLYRMNLLKLTAATASEKMVVALQIIWVVMVGTVLVKGIYFKLFGRTPGMRVMKLQLVSRSNSELTWGQCLLRSTLWSLEWFLLGLPLLEIFSHPQRRAIHDRASETDIITLKAVVGQAPLAMERSAVHFLLTSFLMISLGWISALFSGAQTSLKEGSMALADWRESERLCPQVDEVITYSQANSSSLAHRLDFSTSLYLLEQIDSDCFRKEVDLAFLKKVEGPLVWVGRALLEPPYSEARQENYVRACTEDSRWCQKSLYLEKAALDETKEYAMLDSQAPSTKPDLAYQTARLIIFNRLGISGPASELIARLQANGIRATGLVREHLMSLSREKPESVPAVLNSLKSVLVEKDFLKLNSELCLRKLEAGCGVKVNECESMNALIGKYKESFSDLMIARAMFKSSICKQDLVLNMEYWTLVSDPGLQRLIRLAMELDQSKSHSLNLAKVRTFVSDDRESVPLRLDALQILLEHSNLATDWKLVPYLWTRFDWTEPGFLGASEWLLREGHQKGQGDLILSMKDRFSVVPGLSLDWKLLMQNSKGRWPASKERVRQ